MRWCRGDGRDEAQDRETMFSHLQSGHLAWWSVDNRPIRLTQCCTQFKSPGVKILCVLYLHYNVAFSFKCMEIPETKSFNPKGFELGTTLT